jgi:Domain of unknown function DUF29
MAKAGALYEQDFFLWTKEQAAALRLAKNSNLPLDWENLAEEIERKSDRRELRSQIRRILRHLLKLEATPSVGLLERSVRLAVFRVARVQRAPARRAGLDRPTRALQPRSVVRQ